MATAKICDWSKRPIPPGAPTFEIKIGDVDKMATFEVDEQSYNELYERLQSLEVPQSVAQASPAEDERPFHQRASKEEKAALMEQSQRHEPGSLSSLDRGKDRKTAQQKLREIDNQALNAIERKASDGTNINFNNNQTRKT